MSSTCKLLGVAVLVAGAAFATVPADASLIRPQAQPAPKNIDLVICLDISGSMNGLVDSARAKLWDIVNQMARIQPTPNLRVALYSYGGSNHPQNAGYVKKELDLSTDLDELYQKLFALRISGSVEYVARVSRDATQDLNWSKDPNALKIIFVCGNEHASQDPQITLRNAADLAKARGIVINPIFCGDPQTKDAEDWIEYAALTGGRFAAIDQNKGTVAISTPVDKKLVELGAEMNKTYLQYGKLGHEKQLNQVAQDKNAEQAGYGVAAGRMLSKNTALYKCEDWDLVDRCKTDPKFDITKVPDAELPEVMRKMTMDQRVAFVKDMTAKRQVIQDEVLQLNEAREKFIRDEMKRNPSLAERTFDTAIRAMLREQAKAKGIEIPE